MNERAWRGLLLWALVMALGFLCIWFSRPAGAAGPHHMMRGHQAWYDTAGATCGAVISGETGCLELTGLLRVDGNSTFGDAATDTVTVNAEVASDLIPDGNGTRALGGASNKWDGYLDNVLSLTNIASNVVPEAGGTRDLGASGTRWNNVYGVSANFSGDATFSGGDIIGVGGVAIDLGEVQANAGTFTGSAGWLPSGGSVPLGATGNRWSTVYGVDANFSGNTTLGDAVGDALTIKPTTWTVSDTTNVDTYVAGANSTLNIINSDATGATRTCTVSIDGALIIGDDVDPAAASIPVYFGDTSHYFRWNNGGYFHASHSMHGTWIGAFNGSTIAASGNSALGNGDGDVTTVTGTFVEASQSQGDVAGPGTIALTRNVIVFTGLSTVGAVGYITGGSGTQIITLINTDAQDAVVMHTKEGAGAGHLHLAGADVTLDTGDTMMLIHAGSTDAWNLLCTSDNTE